MNGQIMNNTSETLLVYGPLPNNDEINGVYRLPKGRKTPPGWDCDGFYVPNDRKAITFDTTISGPVAIKFKSYRSAPISDGKSGQYICPTHDGVFKSGEVNWTIPNLSYKQITAVIPEVPGHLKA